MKRYLHLFSQHSIYNLNKNSLLKPNVSYCQEEDHLHYNPIDYSKEYLTTIAREDGTISFNIFTSMGTNLIASISYSTDNGTTWTTTQNQDDKSENLQITVNVSEGDKVLWKGDAQQTGYFDVNYYTDYVGSFFSSTAEFNVQGNVMSLLYGDDFYGETTLEYEGQFCRLFSDYDENSECKVVNANKLILPATTLTDYCYYLMFNGCTHLVNTPQLPATTLAANCYDHMFQGCTSLVNAPELPATTLAYGCYSGMFSDCISLTVAPQLPATALTEYCYNGMFAGTSLITAPQLPATTLANNCYESMFMNCTNLISAPQLPATTLVGSCYRSMFYQCTSLIVAPDLPTIILANQCYGYMFKGCTSLNYIKAMFTTAPSDTYTKDWVNGIATSGTFVKNSAAQWDVSGANGIPNGWTVQTASE